MLKLPIRSACQESQFEPSSSKKEEKEDEEKNIVIKNNDASPGNLFCTSVGKGLPQGDSRRAVAAAAVTEGQQHEIGIAAAGGGGLEVDNVMRNVQFCRGHILAGYKNIFSSFSTCFPFFSMLSVGKIECRRGRV